MADVQLHRARVPELDGLRGIAVLLVVASHLVNFEHHTAGRNPLDRVVGLIAGAGWLGVDLFFVLSGFLITGILHESKRSRHYFRTFYGRRLVRIFPLYYGFLFLVFYVFPRVQGLGSEFQLPTGIHQWQWWTYVANCTSVFGSPGTPVLTPTWSLCIEEQFYLVWPLLVLVCSRHRAMLLSGGMILGALIFRACAVSLWWPISVPYFFTLARLDSLAVGSAVALTFQSQAGPKVLTALARRFWWVPAAGIVACIAAAGAKRLDVRQYPPAEVIIYLFNALFFGCCLTLCVSYRPAVLRTSALRFFGKHSYCIYLFHEVFRYCLEPRLARIQALTLGSSHLPGVIIAALIIGSATTCFAFASWHAYEKNWLRLKKYFPEPAKQAFVSPIAMRAEA